MEAKAAGSQLPCALSASGSLPSRHFANFYLGPVDRCGKEVLGFNGYVRYTDDSAAWSNDRTRLKRALGTIRAFVEERLSLRLKEPLALNRLGVG